MGMVKLRQHDSIGCLVPDFQQPLVIRDTEIADSSGSHPEVAYRFVAGFEAAVFVLTKLLIALRISSIRSLKRFCASTSRKEIIIPKTTKQTARIRCQPLQKMQKIPFNKTMMIMGYTPAIIGSLAPASSSRRKFTAVTK
jgi:hypothetical protein